MADPNSLMKKNARTLNVIYQLTLHLQHVCDWTYHLHSYLIIINKVKTIAWNVSLTMSICIAPKHSHRNIIWQDLETTFLLKRKEINKTKTSLLIHILLSMESSLLNSLCTCPEHPHIYSKNKTSSIQWMSWLLHHCKNSSFNHIKQPCY